MATPQAWRTDGDLVIGVIVTDAGRAIIEPPVAEETPAEEIEQAPVVPTPTATRAAPCRASSGAASSESLRTDPVNHSAGPFSKDLVLLR